MKRIRIIVLLAVLTGIVVISCNLNRRDENTKLSGVVFQTELGEIEIEVFTDKAPLTSANFMRYVDENRFSGASFYRVVTPANQPDDSIRIQVIQGGLGFVESDLRLPPIPHESTKETGILHQNGIISMARLQPGTAGSEFFICIEDQPELDYGGMRNPDGQGFAAFGQVVGGMDVVKKIQEQSDEGQMLVMPIKILEVKRSDM